MAIVQSNIPSIKNAKVFLDISGDGDFTETIEIEGEITEVNVSGGDYTTANLPVLDGTVFTSTGEKQPYEVTVTAVYTEGADASGGSDLHELVYAKHGNSSIGLRWAPAGQAAGNKYFQTVGVLFRVMPPALQRNGDILYSFALRGDITTDAFEATP